MHNKTMLAAGIAMSLTMANPVFANGDDRYGERGRNEQAEHRGKSNEHRNDGRHDRGKHDRDHDDERRGPGAGPNHNFYRGERLSSEYRHRNYVVDDWRGHHLSAPPRGYQWVQTGADYVLIAIATGIIVQILLHG